MSVMKMMAYERDLDAIQARNATSLTGASSHTGDGWHDINWQKVHQNVRRLQARIVKATQEKRWGKVKALQRLLTRSFGRFLAKLSQHATFTKKMMGARRINSQHRLNGVNT